MLQRHQNRRLRPWPLVNRLVLSLVLTAALLVVDATAGTDRADASSQDEQHFVQLANELRASRGVPALAVHSELSVGARSWTAHMAGLGQLAHSPDMSAGVTAQWSVLGENVGMHGIPDVGQLFQAFVNSPAHYQNLVDPRFNHIGVGVVTTSDGTLWTTHRFMSAPAPAPPTTVAAPPPTTAPPVIPTTPAPTVAPTAPPTTQTPTTAAPIAPPTTQVPTTGSPTTPVTEPYLPILPTPSSPSSPTTEESPPADDSPTDPEPTVPPILDDDVSSVDDPSAGPAAPDVPTIEQVLVELVEAGM